MTVQELPGFTELTNQDVYMQGVIVLTEIFNGWELYDPAGMYMMEKRFARTFGYHRQTTKEDGINGRI